MRTEGLKIGILSISFTLLGVLSSRAQETCDDLTSTVGIVYRALQGHDEQALISIADTARRARECYADTRARRRIWLLNKEIWALDGLGRRGEAEPLVDLFFEDLVGDADDLDRGGFYLWRLLFHLYDGDFEAVAVAYGEAMRYADALPLAQQAGLRNNGAVLAFRRERFEEAERETTVGIALLDSIFRTRDEAVELAKLLQKRGEARLAAFKNDSASPLLDPARRDLHASIALRDSLSIPERQAEAYVTLGEIYHALGDGQAGRGYMGTGLRLAREGGNPRGEIFALWRTGRMSRRGGLSSLARQQLRQALNLSQESGVGEFKLFIELELARLFEDRQAWRRAEDLYRAVVETPDDARYRSRLFDDAKARDEAERRRVVMRMHLAEEQASWLRLALLGLALLLLLGSGAALTQRRRFVRLRNRYAVLRNGTPEEDNLFDRRRRYAYRVLERPAEVAVVLGKTDLSVLLVAGLADRTQLYACVCALEKALEDRVIDPENMRRYLHHHFTKKGWDWPESLDTWKEHFRERPI